MNLLPGSARGRDRGSRRFPLDPALVAVVIGALAVCAPFFRYVTSLGDEGVLLHGAARIAAGEVPYLDFFAIVPPLSYLFQAGWMRVAGESFGGTRVLSVAVIASIAVLAYLAARKASGRPGAAAAGAFGWLLLSQGAWTVANHHWFCTAASLASGLFLLASVERPEGSRSSRFPRSEVLAGFFAGAAAMSTSTRGALLAATVLLVLAVRGRPAGRWIAAGSGLLLVPAASLAWLASVDALRAAIDSIVLFPARHYVKVNLVPFGSGMTSDSVLLVTFFPATLALAAGWASVVGPVERREPKFHAALALALVGLVGAWPRPDVAHLGFSLPLGLPLFARCIPDLCAKLRPGVRRALSLALLVVLLPSLAGAFSEARSALARRPVSTPRGTVVPGATLNESSFESLIEQLRQLPAGDGFLFYPYSPMLPYLTARQHVARVDVFVPGYTSPAQYRESCEQATAGARWAVVDRRWADVAFLRTRPFPALTREDTVAQLAFEAELRRAFDEVVGRHGTFEVRRRGAATARCERITGTP